ncbi:hypothetical protein pb186bvf_003272 [Paramecium bursaria]
MKYILESFGWKNSLFIQGGLSRKHKDIISKKAPQIIILLVLQKIDNKSKGINMDKTWKQLQYSKNRKARIPILKKYEFIFPLSIEVNLKKDDLKNFLESTNQIKSFDLQSMLIKLIALIFICYSLASEREEREKQNERENEREKEKETSKKIPVQILSMGSSKGSYLGGTEFRLKVAGLDSEVANNKVLICDKPCEIPDDGIDGVNLKCITPSANSVQLFSSDPNYFAFFTQSCIITIKVKDKQTFEPAAFQIDDQPVNWIYWYSYSQDYTPITYQLILPQSNNKLEIQKYFEQIRIKARGKNLQCEFYQIYGPTGYFPGSQTIGCVVPQMEAGFYLLNLNSASGYAYQGFYSYKKRVYEDILYQVVVVPIITKLSTNKARKNGQVLKIDGQGFSKNTNNIKVDINGYSANVQIISSNFNQIVVSVKNLTEKYSNSFLQGSGLRHTIYNITSFDTCPNFRQQLLTNITSLNDLILLDEVALETEYQDTLYSNFNYSDYYRGFFKAPKTGQYRFYLQSGNWAAVYIQTQPNVINQTNLSMIIQNDKGEYRKYYQEYLDQTYKSHRSDFIKLVENNYYYIEIFHCSFWYSGHLTVSLEIEESVTTSRSLQDIYVLNTSYQFIPTKYELYIYNNESDFQLEGKYQFIFPTPTEENSPYPITEPVNEYYRQMYKNFNQYLSYNASIQEIRSYFNYQYNGYFFTTSQIVREKVDFTRKVVDPNKLTFAGYKYTFTFSINPYLSDIYPPILKANKLSKKGGKPFLYSNQINGSSPLVGNLSLQISYYDQNGDAQNKLISYSYFAGQNQQNQQVIDISQIQCFFLSSLIQSIFSKVPICQQIQNPQFGFQIILTFTDFPELIDITIPSSNLKAGNQILQALVTKIQERSNNTLYEPIPQELLFTFNNKPQVNLYVNDILASCFDDNCQFYMDQQQSFSLLNFTINSNKLTTFIQVINYANFKVEQFNIKLGGSQCNNINLESFQQIHKVTCYLEQINGNIIIEAGDHVPIINIDDLGYAYVGTEVTPIQQAIQIISVTPNKVLTTGGALLSIKGIGFPHDDDKDFQIKISGKILLPISINNQEIIIEAPPKQTDNTIEINYRGKIFTSSSLLTYEDIKLVIIQSLEFNSANPVFKGYLKIYADNLGEDIKLLNCTLQSANKTYMTPIKSLQSNILTVYLRGGMPGDYRIIINKIGYGLSKPQNENSNKFQYGVFITSISPQTGSNGGGNLITISGRNFVLEETFVFIGQSLQCDLDLERSTNSSILCLTQPRPTSNQYDLPQQAAVITRGSLESVCDIGSTCTFQYLESLTTKIERVPLYMYSTIKNRLLVQEDIETQNTINNFKSQKTKDNIINQEHLNNQNNRRILQQDQIQYIQVKEYTEAQSDNLLLDMQSTMGQYSIILKGNLDSYTLDATYYQQDSFAFPSLTFDIPDLPQGDYQTYVKSSNGYADKSWISRFKLIIKSATQSKIGSYGSEIFIIGKGFNQKQKFEILIDGDSCEDSQVLNYTAATCLYRLQQSANQIKVTQLDSKDNSKIQQTLIISGASFGNTILNNLGESTNLINNEANVNYIGDLNLINIVVNGYGLSDAEYIPSNVEKIIFLQSSNGKINGTLSSESNDTQLMAQFQNIPIGRYYIVYAVGPQYQKTYVQTNFQLYIQGQNYITVNTIISSIAGGPQLVFQGQGLDQETQNNKIKVCGKKCSILSVSQDVLRCEIPALLTSDIVKQYPMIQEDFDSLIKRFINYLMVLNQHVLKIVDSLVLELQMIRYSTNLDYQMMEGAKFQYQISGQQDWIYLTLIQNIEFGYNTIIPKNPINNIKKLRIIDASGMSRIILCELKIIGRLTYESSKSYNEDQQCDVQLTINDFIYPVFQQRITYKFTQTPIVNSVSQFYVPTDYSTEISIIGSGFGTYQNLITVSIDYVSCTVTYVSDNLIKCTTGIKDLSTNQITGVFRVQVDNNLAINLQIVQYGNLWSQINTWGGAVFPSDGDSVIVQKGQTLIVDMVTPKLVSIFVEGILTFADNGYQNSLDANYIIIHYGKLQIGSKQKPYQSQASINLRGDIEQTQLGLFGNKVLACYYCQFQVFGQERLVWTTLGYTIQVGDTQLFVDEEVDWKVGEQILITSSNFDQLQTEVHTINQISADKKTISTQLPFLYQHYSDTEAYGVRSLNNKVQVGLLSRNIQIMGEKSISDYGYHFTVYGDQYQGTQVQIQYAEFINGGQPQIVGRYPIYFRQNKILFNSYLIGNSIHDNNARCITIKNVEQLIINNNICYNTFGNSIYFETGNEINNIISHNLVSVTKTIDILFQNDISPASYFIQNPQNSINQNIAAGSDYAGFILDFKSSTDLDLTDYRSSQLITEFSQNQAYSNKYYGLYILNYIPNLNYGQQPRDYISQDPFSKNQPIKSTINDFISRLNGKYGIYIEQIGNVEFSQSQLSDNKIAALYVRESDWARAGLTLDSSLIVGHSKIANVRDFSSSAIILPRTEFFTVTNTYISNFEVNDVIFRFEFAFISQQLQQNSFNVPYNFKGMKILNSQNAKFNDFSFRLGIIVDQDGSLTNNKIPSYIIPQKRHIEDLEGCQIQTSQWDQVLFCETAKVSIRDLSILQAQTQSFLGQFAYQRNIRRLIQDQLALNETGSSLDQYQTDQSESIFATNNAYNIHFNDQINPEIIGIMESNYLVDDDKGTIFRFNFSLIVKNVSVQTSARGLPIQNATNINVIPSLENCTNADWYLDNSMNVLFLCLSSKGKMFYQQINIQIEYVHDEIQIDDFPNVTVPDAITVNCGKLLWSNQQAWPFGILPNSSQEKVTISKCQEIILDIDPPNLQQIEIYGTLIFDDTRFSSTLNARNIAILSGQIIAGNETNPFQGNINIFINGDQYTNQFLVAGKLELFGNAPNVTHTRLIEFANKGDKKIVVDSATGWKVGDFIVIGPSGSDPTQTEEAIIESIVDNNISLLSPLKYYHYGAPSITIILEDLGQLDMRAVVGHLSRNIRIISGQNQNQYGCQIQVQNYKGYIGYLKLSGVEVQKCGQPQSEPTDHHPALDINVDGADYDYIIKGCAFHHSYGTFLRIQFSSHFTVSNNVFYNGQDELVYINSNKGVLFEQNLLIYVKGAFARFLSPTNMIVQDNIGTASQGSGFILSTSACSDKKTIYFHDNQCSSVSFACFWYQYNNGQCDYVGRVSAYHSQIGVLASLQTNQIESSELILVENTIGLMARMENQQVTSNQMFLTNSYISSFARPDCQQCYSKDLNPFCTGTVGIQLATVSDKSVVKISPFTFYFSDKITTIEAVDARVYLDSIILDGFKDVYDETPNCGLNAAFRQNLYAYDMTAQYYLTNTKQQNSNNNGLFYGLRQPDPTQVGWLGGCGTFKCTGLQNILVQDQDGSLLGTPQSVIADNEYFGPNVTSCKRVEKWQGYQCSGNQISVLNFMSTAPDKIKRLYSPIQLTDGVFFNQINSFREWSWTDSLPQNKRESKFIALITVNTTINMTNAGDNPTESVYWLSKRESQGSPNDWIILKWQFNSPNMIQVSVGDTTIQPGITQNNNHWDLSSKLSECGANNYFFENKTIHFVVTGHIDCSVKVSLKNSIKVTSRITVTETEFVSKNFLQYAFAQLGGDPYNYFIVGIRKTNRRLLQGESLEIDWVYADPAPVGSAEADTVDTRLEVITQKVQTLQSSPSSSYKIVSSSVQKSVIDIKTLKSTEPTTAPYQPPASTGSQQSQQIQTPKDDLVLVPLIPQQNDSNPIITDPSQPKVEDIPPKKETSTPIPSQNPKQSDDDSYKIIIGVVVGGVIILAVMAGLIYFMRQRRSSKVKEQSIKEDIREDIKDDIQVDYKEDIKEDMKEDINHIPQTSAQKILME